jgi:hypothetical protein
LKSGSLIAAVPRRETRMASKTIFTLNARSNVFLGVTRDHFNIQSSRMFDLIQEMFADIEAILLRKRIDYGRLKTALVPSTNRREIALIFDSTRVKGIWYGGQIFERSVIEGQQPLHSPR